MPKRAAATPGEAGPTGLRIAVVGQGNFPIPPPGYAPVERHIAGLVGALRRRGEDVHVVNRVLPRFRLRLLAHALWVSARLRRLRPDVVHCHSPINAWVLRRLGHAPVVFTTHSREWVASRQPGYRETAELRRHARAVRASHAAIVLSGQVRDAVRRRPGLEGVEPRVVPNGVDPGAFFSPRAAASEKRLVGVGVVARVKRWHLVAQALQGTGWSLDLVGPVNHPDYAEELRALPGVRVAGAVGDAEVLESLRRASVLAHPSQSEAMSLAVLEGMAAGLPVLGSQVLREIVDDGVEGRLVPEAGEAEMVAAYRRILAETPEAGWRAMGEAARRRVEREHSWDQVAQRTCEVYRSVAGARRRRPVVTPQAPPPAAHAHEAGGPRP